MNASECCQTIGCNCAGTQSIETIMGIPYLFWIVGGLVITVILFIIISKFSMPKQ